MKYKKCRKCGHENPMENRYCSKCGTAFRNMVPLKEMENTNDSNKKAKMLTVLVTVIVSISVVLLIGITKSSSKSAAESKIIAVVPTTDVILAECIHDWKPADCVAPKTCVICGETSGVAIEHQWKDATYETPKTCSICQHVEGEPLNNPLVDVLRTRLPIVAFSISSEPKVYGYDDSALTHKNGDYYFIPFIDEIVITNISQNGLALEVRYPSSITQSGYRTLWFPIDDIIPIAEPNITSWTAEEKTTTYRFSENGSSLVQYGSMDVGNKFDSLGTHELGYKVVIYSIYDKTIYGIDVDNKMALVKAFS